MSTSTATLLGVQVPTSDADRSAPFYRDLFGWSFVPDEHLPGILHADAGLAFSLSPVHGPHAPGGTFLNVAVEDLDATLEQAARLGSRVLLGRTAAPFGAIAMIDDPSGAHLLLVELP